MSLFIKTFRLIGNEKNYEFDFKKGLNFISGPTSTGKTTIFELIDYALGAKKHKSYIEISHKCTDVELEIIIENTKYKIKRRLFDFNLPVRVEIWDEKIQQFVEYGVFNIDNSNNDSSLSNFLLSKLGLDGVKIANQNLSFRDMFKYSYLKQIEIDNEDILSSSSNPFLNNKRKSTFEIIFNIYDQMLGELKAKLKASQEELRTQKLRHEGIEDFLKKSDIESFETVHLRRAEINKQIEELNKLLKTKNNFPDNEPLNPKIKELIKDVQLNKKNLNNLNEELNNQKQYILKLKLLDNQYVRDIEKIDAALLGIKEVNKYDFLLCPNCMKPITSHADKSHCLLCGNPTDDLLENTIILKKEKSNTNRKKKQLIKHIEQETERKNAYSQKIKKLQNHINNNEKILEQLTKEYVNPYIEEISYINITLGSLYEEQDNLDNSLRFIRELNRLKLILSDQEKEVNNLKKLIEEKSKLNDKDSVLKNLSTRFENILKNFKFPKLENAYIDSKNYLPYVRNRKYNDLGSLGAVTLITMAYYLSVFTETVEKNLNHLNFLLIDTPRKNLGTSSKSEDFQDEEIYNSVIEYFISLESEVSKDFQLIIINNGYPDFLPKNNIVIEFPSDGQTGLIDDI